ncbi:PREDICTED: heterodimeric geranylgeranyl pyrophosphate synthase small subunit, chloroplastic-like [Ipomoea nil]|uniref:heterodimeric geranylgeranyl pyrophosphate synthase small subunit, chloroplastic-like n=1 Tax=Ipomoea nil TaxID=35883 RepID=UPI0009014051|nr:PREDICTED: heterodimeric geranylgeranyl pyrophosphate synthase small subunit, chloroplastic-like [Ipomoea nil]
MAGAFSNPIYGKPAAIPARISCRSLVGFRPRAVMVAENQSYWASIEADIEAHLKKALPVRPPASVFEPLRYLALAAPRTTAPALCVAACELFGGDREQAMDAASAIHLMHAATHAHRHLPLSSGVVGAKASEPVYHKFGPNIELLTGDALIPFGLELLARSMDYPTRINPDKIVRVIIEITRATGSQGVLDAINGGEKVTGGGKRRGLLHACGAACGGIIGGGSEEEIERLRNFGHYVEMINGVGTEEKMKEWKISAMKELERLEGREIGQISSLLALHFCSV